MFEMFSSLLNLFGNNNNTVSRSISIRYNVHQLVHASAWARAKYSHSTFCAMPIILFLVIFVEVYKVKLHIVAMIIIISRDNYLSSSTHCFIYIRNCINRACVELINIWRSCGHVIFFISLWQKCTNFFGDWCTHFPTKNSSFFVLPHSYSDSYYY